AWCYELERMAMLVVRMRTGRRRRAAMVDIAAAVAYRYYGRMRRGRVSEAESDARESAKIYRQLDTHHAMLASLLAEPLIARGAFADAEQVMVSLLPTVDPAQAQFLLFLDTRARLRLAQG